MRGTLSRYRRLWVSELLVLLALAAGSTAFFAWTDFDITTARAFFRPGGADPWPVADEPLWAVLYGSAPWVTASLALAGIAALIVGVRRDAARQWRIHGVFILLSVALGPGLVVNGVLKDHWGRPRPRQIEKFGGLYRYVPPLLTADTPGRSFPCGHCSVGYLYALGWWIWRRRRPRLALLSLAAGTVAGTLLGLGRLAAGGHFLSDALWSALVAWGVAHLLYHHVLRVPAREDAVQSVYPLLDRRPALRRAALASAVFVTAGIVTGGIVASPHHRSLAARARLDDYPRPPVELEVTGGTLDVELRLVTSPVGEIVIAGDVYGFGLPGNELGWRWEFEPRPRPTLRYRVTTRGWFPDIDGLARIEVPVGAVETIRVSLGRGNIVVVDEAPGREHPALDLDTADGSVRRRRAR